MADQLMTNINPLPPAPMPPDGPTPAAPQTTADRARMRLAAIVADKEMGRLYRNGDVAIIQEIRSLNMAIAEQPPADKLGAVLAGTAAPGRVENTDDSNPLTTTELMSGVDGLRKFGHSDAVIREIIEGAPVTEERHREAQLIRDRILRDKAWMRAYRDGSGDHVEQLHRLNAVLAAPIKVVGE